MKLTGLPGWRDWLFSLKAYIASMAALYIALATGMERPYWAMAAVYVVANPLSGATRSKALYRAFGTFLGAAGSVLLLPMFSNAPELFSLVVALWTGCFLFLSFLDRTPRSYVFMLAGYTLPLIALPAVGNPSTVFDLAIARSQEITLGIACASIVNALFFPVPVGPVLGAHSSRWLKDAGAWVRDMLLGEGDAAQARDRQRLAADIRAMDMLISQLGYDSAIRGTVRRARELRGRMAMLLPVLSSLSDRLAGVRGAGATPPELSDITAKMLAWMQSGETGESTDIADGLRAQIAELEPKGAASTAWNGLLLSSALERMRELVDIWQDCQVLRAEIALGDRAGRFKPAYAQRRLLRPVNYYDYGMLAFSAGSVVVATFLSAMVWILTGWNEGAGCVVMTAVGCSFFAALDNPAPQIKSFVVWMSVSIVASAVYLFAILPGIHDFVPLAAVFAVPFLLVGTMTARPQFAMIVLLLIVNIASLVGLSASYSADFASFANGNIASVAGGVFGLVWVLLTRPFGAALAARRLVVAGWADIASTARGGRNADPERFAGRVFDRLSQLVPRLAQGIDADIAATDVLAELRLGLNIVDLQRLRPSLPVQTRWHLGNVLEQTAVLFSRRVEHRKPVAAGTELQESIDETLADLTATEPDATSRAALQSLIGLRRVIFPNAEPPHHLGAGSLASPQAIAAE